MLYPSHYNHLVTVTTPAGDEVRIISNTFVGAANFVDHAVFSAFEDAEATGFFAADLIPESVIAHFTGRGFLWTDPYAEEVVVRGLGRAQGNRVELAAGLNGGQYGFITTLHCNLACPYCFQRNQADSVGFWTRRNVDLGLEAIAACEKPVAELLGKRSLPRISITGGEPLLRNRQNASPLTYLIARLDERGWPFNITTNGTELEAFVARTPLTPRCRNIQVTLDGPSDVHDQRRFYRGGRPSFEQIARGVDAALSAGWKITLRVNLDSTNVHRLLDLAEFVRDERRWCRFEQFSAYVSPVTDHDPDDDASGSDEATILRQLLRVVEQNPEIRDVFDVRHFRGFNYVEQMLVNNTSRFPVIYRCEAISGMYIFDPVGNVYVCLESVGQAHRKVGRYIPKLQIDATAESKWTSRNALNIPKCENCKIRFLCAGGCAIQAFNTGNETPCMPFLDEMEIAWKHFARTRPELFAWQEALNAAPAPR